MILHRSCRSRVQRLTAAKPSGALCWDSLGQEHPAPPPQAGLIWGSALGIGRKPLIRELKDSLLCAPSLTTRSRAPLFPLWLLTAFSSDHPQLLSWICPLHSDQPIFLAMHSWYLYLWVSPSTLSSDKIAFVIWDALSWGWFLWPSGWPLQINFS